jgi:CubicO group peptidase (beta-lactamase class C family)
MAQPASSTPPTDAELAARLDAYLMPLFPADKPGATVLVARKGKPIYRRGFGMADLGTRTAMTPEAVLRIGSVTKQFTSAAILRLEESGKLKVTDPIEKWLPDFPLQGHTVTIENLLTHTSGIKGYTEVPAWAARQNEDMTHEQVLAYFKDEPFLFEPGTNWAYSNSGYYLLGMIIEKAAGMSYKDYLQKEIFGPLEMTRSGYGDRNPTFPGEARGYAMQGEKAVPADPLSMSSPYAAGALVSSVDDLLKWENALASDRLLHPKSSKAMWTPFQQKSGKTSGYGYGWLMGEYEGHPIQEHNGGINGFLCHTMRLPADDVFVAVLTNSDQPPADPGYIALTLAAEAIGKPMPQPGDFILAPEKLEEFTGVYAIDSTMTRTIVRDGDHLVSQRKGGARLPLFPANDSTFAFVGRPARLTFGRDATGKVNRLTLRQGGYAETALRTDAALPAERTVVALAPESLGAYVGEYQLAPGFTLTVMQEGSALKAQATGQPAFDIYPESETRFFLKVVDAQIDFTKGADGRMSALTLHQGGQQIPATRIR